MTDLRKAIEEAVSIMQSPSPFDAARPLLRALGREDEFVEVWQAAFGPTEAARAENAKLRALLAEFVDDDECYYDHHDYCQTHRLGSHPCEVERARQILAGHA